MVESLDSKNSNLPILANHFTNGINKNHDLSDSFKLTTPNDIIIESND